ncbi:MAG: NAD+ synthase [Pseudomonadota bacterium]|nr:NAD+ synthase [Pseudomonadota bacterium]
MKLALAQINPTVGDISGNAAKILECYKKAAAQTADIVVFPELALVGYPPEDLVLMPSFVRKAMQAATELAKKTRNGPAMIIGCPWEEGKRKTYAKVPGSPWDEKRKIYNAALFLSGGKIAHVAHKIILPNYSVFDEKRIFTPGDGPMIIKCGGRKLGLLVCEDVWSNRLPRELSAKGIDLLVVINASPFEAGKPLRRREVAAAAAKKAGAPLVYVNMVGGQDDIVFDGGSFVLDAKGRCVLQMAEFEEGLGIYPVEVTAAARNPMLPLRDSQDPLWRAMMLGLSDYVGKNGFPGVVLGLSGGIDSALTAAVAVDALGADKVKGVLLPSPYTSKKSTRDALETARLLGIETMEVSITAGMEIFDEVLSPVFRQSGWMKDVSLGGNVQARLRGMTLMAISNKFGWMLLSTGNKSELAVGYSTLYGDSCGGYNVIKDLYKTQVYALADWRNAQSRAIPEHSIIRAPTAELAPGQKDEDQLPPYAVLDSILMLHLEGRLSAEEIIAKGYPKAVVEKIVRLVRINEYKRRQSCPGVRLSPMLFGRDRRFPLTNKF